VTKLLQNKEERIRMGQNARRYIVEKIHRTQIAKENESVYNLARERFASRKEKAIYHRSPAQSLADVNGMIYGYQTMLYNLLYVHSWRFRIGHWFKLLTSRPKLILATLLVRIANKLLGSKAGQSAFISSLNKQVEEIRTERAQLAKLGCFK
jgi:hypothetical protein